MLRASGRVIRSVRLSETKLDTTTHCPVRGSLRTIQESEQVRPGESSEQEVLSRLAAIRAAAEILDDNDDLSPSDRRLFLSVIQTETTRLHRMIAG